MDRASVAGRGHVDLARIGPGIGDEFRNSLGRNRWMDHHDVRYSDDAADRGNVTDKIVIELVVERCVDRSPWTDQEKRISVRRCLCDRFHSDIGASPGSVLDDELL